MVCLEVIVKFLSTNPPGIKIIVPLYVKVAKTIILEESFPKKEFGDLAKFIGTSSYENAVNEIRIQAVDALKLCYELTYIFAKLPDIRLQNRTFGNHRKYIFDVCVEILNRIAYENETFKNFENTLKKNIFSLILLILKTFENDKFCVIIFIIY